MTTLRYSKAGAKTAFAALLAGLALALAPLGSADARPRERAGQAAPAQKAAPSAKAKSAAKPAAKAARVGPGEAKAKDADPDAIAAKRDPQYTSASPDAAPSDDGCYRQRKRLWVEGEGWIVRRVPVCQ